MNWSDFFFGMVLGCLGTILTILGLFFTFMRPYLNSGALAAKARMKTPGTVNNPFGGNPTGGNP